MPTKKELIADINDWYAALPSNQFQYHDGASRDEAFADLDPKDRGRYFLGWAEFNEHLYSDEVTLPSGLVVKDVERYGGEGEGDKLWVVFSVDDQLFRVTGYYSSWDGDNWEDASLEEVEAYEVMVTKYRKK